MAKINDKQKLFCEYYIANGYNASKAYKKAYGDIKGANVAAYGLLRKPHIVEHIKLLEGDYRVVGYELGIDKKKIIKRLKDLLSAKKQVFLNKELIEVDDHPAVLKAAEMLLKIYGDFSPEKSVITLDDEGDIDVAKLSKEERKEYKEKLLRSL